MTAVTITRGDGTRVTYDLDLLTPGEVAGMFKVDPKTIVRWTDAGKLDSIKTPGGHRRYFADQVKELAAARKKGRRARAGAS